MRPLLWVWSHDLAEHEETEEHEIPEEIAASEGRIGGESDEDTGGPTEKYRYLPWEEAILSQAVGQSEHMMDWGHPANDRLVHAKASTEAIEGGAQTPVRCMRTTWEGQAAQTGRSTTTMASESISGCRNSMVAYLRQEDSNGSQMLST